MEAVLLKIYKIRNHPDICYIYWVYDRFTSNIANFRVYVLWYKHWVLCGISDIFPRQTIRDLLKTFCRWESKLSFSKYTKSKIIQFVLYFRRLWSILPQILPTFRIYILRYKHKVLCGISYIFSRQTIRDLLKIFCRWESKLSFWKYTKSKFT